MPDPRKDPRFKELFESKNTIIGDVLKAQAEWDKLRDNDLIRQTREIEVGEAKRKQSQRTALSEALMGAGEGDVLDRARPVFAEYGDVDAVLGIDKAGREEQRLDSTQDTQRLNVINKLAEVNPELAMQMWNSTDLGKKYGMITDASHFAKPPQIKSGPGMLYHVDKDGKIVVDYEKPEKPDNSAKGPGEKIVKYKTKDGGIRHFNERDPEQRRQIEELSAIGEIKPMTGAADNSAILKSLLGLDDEEEQAPSMPTATPAPTPVPKQKRRVVVVPKGISQ